MNPARPFAIALAAAIAAPFAAAQACQPFKVLVFTKTAGFVHAQQITAGIALIQSLGAANGFAVDQTADAAQVNAANLAQYSVVVFLHTTGDILDAAQQTAFEGFVASGGGFVGIHSAADTEYAWPFYGNLLGAWFAGHPPTQVGTLSVANANHPATATLPASFAHDEEWYNYSANVASNPAVSVLLTVDEASYTGGTMGAVHPIAWCQDSGTWRSFYTGLGHTLPQYAAPWFAQHLLGGILWAAGATRTTTVCGVTPYGAASGAGALALGGTIHAPTHVAITGSGASAGGLGVLALGTCPLNVSGGGITVLVDIFGPGFLGFLPLGFDAAGAAQLVIPHTLQLPGTLGLSLHLQGAELAPTLALSNGLRLSLCP
jgi:type 1 glutamine amidotransferase